MKDYDLSQLGKQEESMLNEYGFVGAHIFELLHVLWIADVESILRSTKLIEADCFA